MNLECGDVFARLSEFLDGELSDEAWEKMRSHIAGCEPCVEFVDSLRKSVALSKQVPPVESPSALSAECREALLQAYRAKVGA